MYFKVLFKEKYLNCVLGAGRGAIAAAAGGAAAQRAGRPEPAAALCSRAAAVAAHTLTVAIPHLRALRVPKLRVQPASRSLLTFLY